MDDGFVHHGTDVETVWEDDVPYLTPNERFFVRNHTESPAIDARLVAAAGERRRRDRRHDVLARAS